MKEASGCPPEAGRQQGGFQNKLPPTTATAYLGPVLSSAAIASGQGTLGLSWQLFLCAHGDSRSALPVVAAAGLWLITDSPVCNLLRRQYWLTKTQNEP